MEKSSFKKILEQEAVKDHSFSNELKFFLGISWLLFIMIISDINEQNAFTIKTSIGLVSLFLVLFIAILLNNRVVFKILTAAWTLLTLSIIISVAIFWDAFSTRAWISTIALIVTAIMAVRSIRIRLHMIAFRLVRAKTLELFTDYFGEGRVKDQEAEIKLVIIDLWGKKMFRFGLITQLPQKIEFEKYKHQLRQNGRTTIIRSFEFDSEGELKMNYFISEESLEFKPMQYPLTYIKQ